MKIKPTLLKVETMPSKLERKGHPPPRVWDPLVAPAGFCLTAVGSCFGFVPPSFLQMDANC